MGFVYFIAVQKIKKKSRQKNSWNKKKINFFFSEVAILAFLKHFPSSKIDFWPFLESQKMEFGQFFREIDLKCTFFRIFSPLYYIHRIKILSISFSRMLTKTSFFRFILICSLSESLHFTLFFAWKVLHNWFLM